MNKFKEQSRALSKLTDSEISPLQDTAPERPKQARGLLAERNVVNEVPDGGDSHPDAFRGKWPTHIPAAKSKWGKLSDSELLNVAGVESRLADLVRQRYALDEEVASKQVRHFIERCIG